MNITQPTDPVEDFSVFEATPGISAIVKPDAPAYTLLTACQDYFEFVGLKKEELVGKSNLPFLTKETSLKNSFDYVIQNKNTHEIPVQRFELAGRDGNPIIKYGKVKNVPLLNRSGEVRYIIHHITDITDKVLGENNLAPAGISKAYQFFMNAPVIIGYLSVENYRIEFANEGLLKVWEKTKAVIGQPLFTVFPELEAQGTKQLLDQVSKTGKPFFAYEHPLHFNQNGKVQTLYFDFVYQAYYEHDNNVVSGIISVGHDVTEQIRARKVQRSLEELKYANQKLEAFAYAASHDLKDPVRKILFFCQKLKEELKETLDQKQADLFARLETSSSRLQHLIDDLLEYSYAANGSSQLQAVDLNLEMKAVLQDLEIEIQQKHAKIHCGDLPTLKGNGRQMQQLFQNLISNAIKYNKPEVQPEITINCRAAAEQEVLQHLTLARVNTPYHLITISDNGIGFDQRDATKIFDVFTRLHNGSQYRGTGIGLSIVQKVVQSHYGAVWAESEPGKGSAFKILLPADEGWS